MCIHLVVVTGLGRAQRIAQTKLDKRLLSAHRWASVNHTFSTSIHIDFIFSSLELMNFQELMLIFLSDQNSNWNFNQNS